jgi:hypothetical protein
MAADFGLWVWGAIIAFWVISSVVGALRRVKKAAQSSDLGQSSSDLSAKSLDAPQTLDAGQELLAQIQAARRAAATLTVSATRAASRASAPAVVTSAGQALAATLENVLDTRTSQDTMASLPSPVAHRQGLQGVPAALHAPGGLAFAVLSATILGPCTALKSEPQEPGGW